MTAHRDLRIGPARRAINGVAGGTKPQSWVHGYLRAVAWSDGIIVVVSIAIAQIVRFGSDNPLQATGKFGIPATLVSIVLAAAWLLTLRAFHSLDRRVIGSGPEEYSRVVTACFSVFGVLAILDLLFRLNIARGFLVIALPLGTAALLAERWCWRRNLTRQRERACHLEKLLVVGSIEASTPLVKRFIAAPSLGYDVVGVCLPPSRRGTPEELSVVGRSVPVFGDFDDVSAAVSHTGATTVAVTSAEALGHQAMQDLSWDLEGMKVEMLVSPGVTDIAGPRMLVRPAAGLPLLHIDKPRYEGANRFRKATLDRVGAGVALLLLAPVMLAVALAVKLDSTGPVFYCATRIGLNNRPFQMWKFRSMVQDADQIKHKYANLDEGAGVLFKMREDPRITRVGRFIRRYSLDELPQLFNVVRGSMSLVGPRPPLPDEVEKYDGRVARRMLVKPGITGLWQVSGRSDLSWEESVRLDLSYVENWSIMQDIVILWRTARAVVAKDGAY
ncbi:exopolysaccharide biosynthesis polyprenyl glycosylphosphotransferase [Gordonia polyisoprenivorans VH2]|uniref:Exopolysaccharide biosynthesis polyprenyl glycosylphosphotransferase n=1 Tax=Gordonia polyisoprenivorans (strain DSM 44266 / VH2) TaxID=1112204 RepID=H6N1G3_GORPV|nr:sugar transferase [Gordonia polyisoprenivorans]AFA72174.1 exopolysaccharide biosynthesis polyprenyl glycosylphosphotransferase [Gordonia polyisoprenivorans VH2]